MAHLSQTLNQSVFYWESIRSSATDFVFSRGGETFKHTNYYMAMCFLLLRLFFQVMISRTRHSQKKGIHGGETPGRSIGIGYNFSGRSMWEIDKNLNKTP